MRELRVGIIGLGFMGKTHLRAYGTTPGCAVRGVADLAIDAALSASGGNLHTGAAGVDWTTLRRYSTPDEMLDDPTIDAVSICTPTDTHVELTLAALRAGKHVLVEKPVALRAEDVRRVAEAARAADRVCMPAMVMRFWPGWAWLAERVRDGAFGTLESLTMQRLGAGPTWNAEFYRNPARSGGALADLHIHDADFACWLFGRPTAVVSAGTVDRVTTTYRYSNVGGGTTPRRVVAEGGWHHPGFAFVMRYVAVFERASVVFDLAGGEKPVTVYSAGKGEQPTVPTMSGYEAEVRHFVEAARVKNSGGVPTLRATLEDAALVAEVLEAERRSVESGREVGVG
jgi:predicted dehydrogenase